MDKKRAEQNQDQTAKLAEVIAGHDVDTLKSMILDQMGIENQDQLIDRVLDILDGEDEEDLTEPENNVVNDHDNIEYFPQQEVPKQESYKAREEPKSSQGNSGDLFDMLLGNKELLMSMLFDRLLNSGDSKDDPRVQLLYALKPFCNEGRQSTIESAARLMGYSKLFARFKDSKR